MGIPGPFVGHTDISHSPRPRLQLEHLVFGHWKVLQKPMNLLFCWFFLTKKVMNEKVYLYILKYILVIVDV